MLEMENILHKLDNFIRRYHLSLLLRNLVFFVSFFIAIILFFSLVEYTLWLNTGARKVIFYLFIGIVFLTGVWYFLIPFIRLTRFHKRIDRYRAADIIGNYFPEIKDKFRNLLELNELRYVSREKTELLEAAIHQKTEKLSPFHLHKAIDLRKLKRGLFVFTPIVLGGLMLTFTMPEFIKDPFDRIIHYNMQFEKPAPFDFVLQNEQLTGIQGKPVTIELQIEGDNIPSGTEIIINGNPYQMQKTGTATFQYTVHQLRDNFQFHFEANGYSSKNFDFRVITKPTILTFAAELIYPSYTGKQNELLKNITDYSVPRGTKIKWTIRGKDIKTMYALYRDDKAILKNPPMQKSIFEFSETMLLSEQISMIAANNFIEDTDTLRMNIEVIPDNYPAISIQEIRDSLEMNKTYFSGVITDDYGFKSLKFYVRKRTQTEFAVFELPYSQQIIEQRFYYMFDFSSLENWREEEIEYYFTVTDNDGISGGKTTRTVSGLFTIPDQEELKQVYQQKQDDVMTDMDNVLQEAKQLQSEIDQMRFDLLNKKSITWEERNKFNQLLQKQENLEKMLDELKNENTEKNIFEEMMKDLSPELLEKQRLLEEMFENLFSEEMKETMRKLQEMINELNQEKILEQMEKMQLRSDEIEKNLDTYMELFKQLEFEKKMEEMMQNLNDLKQKQDELNTETENKSKSKEELLQEQNEINSEYENIKKDIEDLQKMNEELFDPMAFPDADELMDEISEELNDASENLSKSKSSQAGKNQKSGSEKMQKLSEMMQTAMDEFAMESLEEDIENLKMILKNLIHISFAQERNIELAKLLGPRDPSYNLYMTNQKKLMTRFKIVEDSLISLSKRQIMIQPLIEKDLTLIRDNSQKIDLYLNYGAVAAAMTHQQYLMQSVNNLALLLIEALQEMNEMNMQAQGGGSCKSKQKKKGSNPGGAPSAKTMRQLQEQLNQQMEQLMKQMQDGKNGKEGGMNFSEQFAKMAAEQEAIRRQMQQYSEMLKSMGEFDAKTMNEIMQQMEQTEKDLVNKKFDLQTIKRQNDILVRLLESEKAELEREKDETRKSRTGKVMNKSNPEEFFQYKREKTTSEEIIKSIPPVFNSFYRQKVSKFYFELNN